MFKVNEDHSIYITRGDVASLLFSAALGPGSENPGEPYAFQPGEKLRLKVFEKKNCQNLLLSKDFTVETETYQVPILLESQDTRLGSEISKPRDYWYEIELNPDIRPQTLLGYDEAGPKVFRLYPEGGDLV